MTDHDAKSEPDLPSAETRVSLYRDSMEVAAASKAGPPSRTSRGASLLYKDSMEVAAASKDGPPSRGTSLLYKDSMEVAAASTTTPASQRESPDLTPGSTGAPTRSIGVPGRLATVPEDVRFAEDPLDVLATVFVLPHE